MSARQPWLQKYKLPDPDTTAIRAKKRKIRNPQPERILRFFLCEYWSNQLRRRVSMAGTMSKITKPKGRPMIVMHSA